MIVGRSMERARLDRLVAGIRSGHSGSLVVRGEAGIGKTELMGYAAEAGADVRVLRGVGFESEAELPFAALYLLLRPFLERLDALPGPQAAALRSAFGLADSPVRDRFLVGAATLSFLAELAGDGPVLCLLDDAQWCDQASTDALMFAARRLHAEPIAMVFAVRDGAGAFPDAGIEVLRVDGLDAGTAEELLTRHGPGLAEPVRSRILAESRGNPLAMIELAAALRMPHGTGGAAPPLPVGPLPAAGRMQEAFQVRVAGLPAAARTLLLIAAADAAASVPVVLRAAARLGAKPTDLEPAERARLVSTSGDTLLFRHPLIRSAVYQLGPHAQRAAAHRALAEVLEGASEADRRAWHLAVATTEPDEAVAAELERAARRAGHRGGSAAMSSALERAARLSPDLQHRARRLVDAGRAAYDAGRPDRATHLAEAGAALSREPSVLAEAAYLRAQVAYEDTSPAEAAALALDGAELIAGTDPERAVSMLTEAVWCARDAGAHPLVHRCADRLAAIRLPAGSAQRPVADALIGFRYLLEGTSGRAIAAMRALVRAAQDGSVEGSVERVIAGFTALLVADDEAATSILESLVADLRMQGALGWLSYALEPLAIAQLLRGRFRDAAATVAEGLAIARDIDQQMQTVALQAITAWLAAISADHTRCRAVAADVIVHSRLHPTNAALAAWALGVLDLADGAAESAFDQLAAVCAGPARHDVPMRAVPDLVEAAVRAGRSAHAARFLPALDAWARHTGQPGASALVRRCHALLGSGGDTEGHFTAALGLHASDDHPFDQARTQLLYGEWLRRQRRRSAARVELTAAWDTFQRLGATAWAARAHTELTGLGDRPADHPAGTDPLAALTPQELQVVRLAAAGLSNREIGAQLFLSPRTIGHHLYRAYPKLGVARRSELARLSL